MACHASCTCTFGSGCTLYRPKTNTEHRYVPAIQWNCMHEHDTVYRNIHTYAVGRRSPCRFVYIKCSSLSISVKKLSWVDPHIYTETQAFVLAHLQYTIRATRYLYVYTCVTLSPSSIHNFIQTKSNDSNEHGNRRSVGSNWQCRLMDERKKRAFCSSLGSSFVWIGGHIECITHCEFVCHYGIGWGATGVSRVRLQLLVVSLFFVVYRTSFRFFFGGSSHKISIV